MSENDPTFTSDYRLSMNDGAIVLERRKTFKSNGRTVSYWSACSAVPLTYEKILSDLDKPISSLNLVPYLVDRLSRNKIKTIRQLAQMSELDIMKMRSMGRCSLYKIKEALEKHNLFLGMQLEGSPNPTKPENTSGA